MLADILFWSCVTGWPYDKHRFRTLSDIEIIFDTLSAHLCAGYIAVLPNLLRAARGPVRFDLRITLGIKGVTL